MLKSQATLKVEDTSLQGTVNALRGQNHSLQAQLRMLWTENVNLQKEVARLELIVYGNFSK